MPISYNLIYTGRRETLIDDFLKNNMTQYIFLNDLLIVIYVDEEGASIVRNEQGIVQSFNFGEISIR